MSTLARRLSIAELSQHILEMAKTGVYRESVFEALQPLATKKQIRLAIAHAKQFGLHSVASLRDANLGTYYQVDLVKYRSSQHAIAKTVPLTQEDNLMQRVTDATQTIHTMLRMVGGSAIGLAIAGVVFLMNHQSSLSLIVWSGAACAAGIWLLQKMLAQKVI